jgi:hypothetical protein
VDAFVFPQPRGNRPGRSGRNVFGIDVGARVVRGPNFRFVLIMILFQYKFTRRVTALFRRIVRWDSYTTLDNSHYRF